VSARSFWPPAEAAQFDYETLRDHLIEQGTLPGGLAAARFARRGLAGACQVFCVRQLALVIGGG
jgi:hypothetical protein